MHKFILILFLIFFTTNLSADSNIDQWSDSKKTYKDLIDDGFKVKAYDTVTINTEGGLIILLFITVLQKEEDVYECQEYQTVDENMQTLDMTLICRRITQPYKIGIGT